MLENVEIVDGDRLVIWDHDGRPVLDLPLLAMQNFNPGICATELLKTMLTIKHFRIFPIEELAEMAARAAKKIRDVLHEE